MIKILLAPVPLGTLHRRREGGPVVKKRIPVPVSKIKIATQEQCSCKVVNKREKIKAVSNLVWVCLKAMI